MTEIPHWVAAVAAAVLGFVGAWAALRVTVATLAKEVAELKSLLLVVNTLQAQHSAFEAELDRMRSKSHDVNNKTQEWVTRLAVAESQIDEHKGRIERLEETQS